MQASKPPIRNAFLRYVPTIHPSKPYELGVPEDAWGASGNRSEMEFAVLYCHVCVCFQKIAIFNAVIYIYKYKY